MATADGVAPAIGRRQERGDACPVGVGQAIGSMIGTRLILHHDNWP
jgi:hypothetical protein